MEPNYILQLYFSLCVSVCLIGSLLRLMFPFLFSRARGVAALVISWILWSQVSRLK